MKSIPLKRLGPEPVISYKDVLVEVIRRPLNPQAGINIAEMKQSLKVLDALDRSNGTLELEDADWEHLKDKTLAMPWAMVDKRIIELVDDVTNAATAGL